MCCLLLVWHNCCLCIPSQFIEWSIYFWANCGLFFHTLLYVVMKAFLQVVFSFLLSMFLVVFNYIILITFLQAKSLVSLKFFCYVHPNCKNIFVGKSLVRLIWWKTGAMHISSGFLTAWMHTQSSVQWLPLFWLLL